MFRPIRSAGFFLVSCVCVSSAAAQQSRFSATPFVGYVWSSPIYDHSTRQSGFGQESRTSQRLATSGAPAAGARIEYHTGPSWSVYLEGSYSPTDVELIDRRTMTGPAGPIGESFTRNSNDARVTALAIAIARRFHFHDGAPALGLSVGGGWQRFRLEKRDRQCQPPSSGGVFCTPEDPWNDTYDLPALVGALTASYDWTRRVGVEARAGYTIGGANTTGFQLESLPEVDEYNAPRTHWVRTAAASIGITIRRSAPTHAAASESRQQIPMVERQSVGMISGTVTDKAGKPVHGAQVSIQASRSLAALTDSAGRYRIANVPPGKHELEVVFIGYLRENRPVDIRAGEHIELSFVLEEETVALTHQHGWSYTQTISVTPVPKLRQDSAVKLPATTNQPLPARSDTSVAPKQWCAAPRTSEPLLMEGIRLGTSTDEEAKRRRASFRMSPVSRDSIRIVHDESVCRRAAEEYAMILRRSVPDLFGSHTAKPVLVVAVGPVYLVDDLRPRDAYWQVMVFDQAWRRRYGYGGGA